MMSNENIKIGDIFYSSWGYEQTNISFYQVVDKNGKSTLTLREVSKENTFTHSMSGETKPIKNHFIGEPIRKRISNNSVKIEDFEYASLWDGKPKYFSCYY